MEKKYLITDIIKGSIAEECEIEKGDFLISINGQEIFDVLDYDFFIKDEEIVLLIEKKNGELEEIEVEKDVDEDLGLIFEEELMDKPRLCRNKCMFCFMDQIPDSMRSTLHYKDDDYRLSFMAGNYVTLTNVDDEDLNRIIRYRMTPINISVHTTNGELRKKMLTNRFADRILDQLEKLANAGISFNAQIVLCPGINDGEELEKTLTDLSKFHEYIGSVAIVPVGLTKFREGLYPLRTFTGDECKKVIEQVSKYQKEFLENYGSRLVFLSDEFYIQAGVLLPKYEEYEDFSQIENGVGMVACFMRDFYTTLSNCSKNELKKTFTLVTGKLVYPMILEVSKVLEEKIEGLKINVVAIENNFFGDKITITGLITGQDIINQLKGKDLGDELIVTEVMLKSDADIFLDDVTLDDVERELNIKVRKVGNGGENFVNDILK